MYNPIIHQARIDLNKEKARLADLLKEKIKNNKENKEDNHIKEKEKLEIISKTKNLNNPNRLNYSDDELICKNNHIDIKSEKVIDISSLVKRIYSIKNESINGDILNIKCKVKFLDNDKIVELYDDYEKIKLKIGNSPNIKKINSDTYVNLKIGVHLEPTDNNLYVLYLDKLNK